MGISLLGICFLGEAPEPAIGPDRRAGGVGDERTVTDLNATEATKLYRIEIT
jgi:hypothetical protein